MRPRTQIVLLTAAAAAVGVLAFVAFDSATAPAPHQPSHPAVRPPSPARPHPTPTATAPTTVGIHPQPPAPTRGEPSPHPRDLSTGLPAPTRTATHTTSPEPETPSATPCVIDIRRPALHVCTDLLDS